MNNRQNIFNFYKNLFNEKVVGIKSDRNRNLFDIQIRKRGSNNRDDKYGTAIVKHGRILCF